MCRLVLGLLVLLMPVTAKTASPTASPTESPTASPSTNPSAVPSLAPTRAPSYAPTAAPSESPTMAPTAKPTYPGGCVDTSDWAVAPYNFDCKTVVREGLCEVKGNSVGYDGTTARNSCCGCGTREWHHGTHHQQVGRRLSAEGLNQER